MNKSRCGLRMHLLFMERVEFRFFFWTLTSGWQTTRVGLVFFLFCLILPVLKFGRKSMREVEVFWARLGVAKSLAVCGWIRAWHSLITHILIVGCARQRPRTKTAKTLTRSLWSNLSSSLLAPSFGLIFTSTCTLHRFLLIIGGWGKLRSIDLIMTPMSRSSSDKTVGYHSLTTGVWTGRDPREECRTDRPFSI